MTIGSFRRRRRRPNSKTETRERCSDLAFLDQLKTASLEELDRLAWQETVDWRRVAVDRAIWRRLMTETTASSRTTEEEEEEGDDSGDHDEPRDSARHTDDNKGSSVSASVSVT